MSTLESVLHGIWGEQWQSKRTALLDSGLATEAQLAQEVDISSFTPWEAVEPQVRQTVVGEGFRYQWLERGFTRLRDGGSFEWITDPEVNPEGYSLSAFQLTEFDNLLASLDAEIESIAAEVVTALGEALLQTIDSREYFFFPIHAMGNPSHNRRCSGTYCYRESISLDGWAIIIDVDSHQFPHLERAYRALVESSNRRRERVSAYLKTFGEKDDE
jgi:hypothetical protein